MADPWSDSQYGGSSAYDNIFGQIQAVNQPSNPYWTNQRTQTTLDQYGTDFAQQFQNAVGRAPTADEINQFYQQAVMPIINTQSGFGGTDPNAVVQQYVPQAFQSQIQQNQQNQMQNLGTQIGDLSSQVGAETAKQLADPNSSAYQAFSGAMNNLGITPSSGAFQAGEGAAVGNAASNTMQQLLSSLGGGAIAGNQSPTFQSLYTTGQNAGQGIAGYNQSLNNFDLQSQLAEKLANEGQTSGIQNLLGMASGSATGAGNLLAGGAQAYKATPWICTAMKNAHAVSLVEVKKLHGHLFPAFWKRPFKFIGYVAIGKFVTWAADYVDINWMDWRPMFFDRVILEPDCVKAVDLYAAAFWSLVQEICARLRIKTLILYHAGKF